MKMSTRTSKWIVLVLTVCATIALGNLGSAEQPPEKSEESLSAFQTALMKTIAKQKQLLENRSYRLRAVNDSIRKTLQAVEVLTNEHGYQKAEALLLEAKHDFPDHIMPYLLLADIYEKQDRIPESNEAFQQFLIKGEKAAQISRDIMDWETRVAFANYVQSKLLSRGIQPHKPKGLHTLPLLARLRWEKGSLLRELVAAGLPLIILLGVPLGMLYRFAFPSEFQNARVERLLIAFYFLCVATYLIWLGHLFLNLPALIQPEELEVAAILIAGTLLLIAFHFKLANEERKEALEDPLSFRCPACKKLIPKLSAVCPACEAKL